MPKRKKRRKRPSKRKNQTVHFKRRFLERYGVDPNHADRLQMIAQIQKGHSRLISAQSLRVSIHAIWFNGKRYPVVYDKIRKSLVTVLPQECLDPKAIDAFYDEEED